MSAIRASVPEIAATAVAVKVAIPLRRPSRFKAVRSAIRIERAEPETLASTSPSAGI